VLVNVTFAPTGEKFRTLQSMMDMRRLNAMTPPRKVRERTTFRLSGMDSSF
jgi:hypothetical protein